MSQVLTHCPHNGFWIGLGETMTAGAQSKIQNLKSKIQVLHEQAGWRADRAFCALAKDLNRRAAKTLFHSRLVRLNGRIAAGSERVAEGDCFEVLSAGVLSTERPRHDPRQLCGTQYPALSTQYSHRRRLTTTHGRHLLRLYEDKAILVISKPAEVLVHRGRSGGSTRRDTIEEVLRRAYLPPSPNPLPVAGGGTREGPSDVARPGGPGAGEPGMGPTRPRPAPGGGKSLEQVGSAAPGFYLVHRLDMETSGCLLIAKTEAARDTLIRAFASRTVHKEYLALVAGTVRWDAFNVLKPIKYIRAGVAVPPAVAARRGAKGSRLMPGQKKGIALEEGSQEGKPCETHFRVVARYRGYTLLCASPKTGRTHQIRVHLQSLGHPLAYDPLYGRATALRAQEFGVPVGSNNGDRVVLSRLPLHAWKLSFAHPETGETISVTAPLPHDLREFLRLLRRAAGGWSPVK